MLRISTLGSGSKGNATVLQFANCLLMVDCGFGIRDTEKRLANLGLEAQNISALLVTHEHWDHIRGVESFAFKYDVPVYMSEGSYRAWKHEGKVTPQVVRANETFSIGEVEILPVAVPHDAREPVQFVFSSAGYKVGVLTDLGSITPHVLAAYDGCHTLFVEANHDVRMLQEGPYPASLKRRVAGNWGHLNNVQTAEFISRVNSSSRLRNLIVGHISEKNNEIDLVAQALESHSQTVSNLVFASQNQPLDWIELE